MSSLPLNVRDMGDCAVSEMLDSAIGRANAEKTRLTAATDALNTAGSISDDAPGMIRRTENTK